MCVLCVFRLQNYNIYFNNASILQKNLSDFYEKKIGQMCNYLISNIWAKKKRLKINLYIKMHNRNYAENSFS